MNGSSIAAGAFGQRPCLHSLAARLNIGGQSTTIAGFPGSAAGIHLSVVVDLQVPGI